MGAHGEPCRTNWAYLLGIHGPLRGLFADNVPWYYMDRRNLVAIVFALLGTACREAKGNRNFDLGLIFFVGRPTMGVLAWLVRAWAVGM